MNKMEFKLETYNGDNKYSFVNMIPFMGNYVAEIRRYGETERFPILSIAILQEKETFRLMYAMMILLDEELVCANCVDGFLRYINIDILEIKNSNNKDDIIMETLKSGYNFSEFKNIKTD